MKKLWSLSLVMLLANVSLWGCGQSQATVYSGSIEGTEIPVQSEVSGTVKELPVAEGSVVKKGQLLLQLDDRQYQLQVQEAQAAVDAALAAFNDAKAGSRAQEIAQAMAGVDQAKAQVEQAADKAKGAAEQVKALQASQAQVESSLQGAQATLAYQQKQLARLQSLLQSGAASQQQVDQAQEAVNQAQTQVNNLQAQWQTIAAQIRQAQAEQAAAVSQQWSAAAAERSAQAKLDLLQAGATDAHLQQLLAQKKQADAKLAQAKLQLSKTRILAPEDGVLLRKNVESGQVVQTGATLFTLLKKGELKVVIYVPEAQLNQVKTGQEATIRVDAYPNQSFAGKVTTISDQAEFTPKNVQTPDERSKMVFAVTIQLTSGLDQLKAGMPADVTLTEKAGGTP